MNGIILFHVVAIPLVFMLGRLSNKIAFLRVKAPRGSSVSEFMRSSRD
ncbi:hypothetical protein [Tumebacillus permanentifrigoris]|jgi:hypothetical protein|uniref:Uncharacterized protein n=1 Tax=Tumebacillus permanentifrigoris TaxID=378543 RepID=A0A316DC50_9BACL|nr:hypothetical protein [Tumebacillus permanentifrigoris]PWK14867.1 hypothetical protein C7459_10467 [Tumebacillus permanentifrigoris]